MTRLNIRETNMLAYCNYSKCNYSRLTLISGMPVRLAYEPPWLLYVLMHWHGIESIIPTLSQYAFPQKNSSKTSLTVGKWREIPGRGLMVTIATVSLRRWGLDLATAGTMSTLPGTFSRCIPFGTNGVGSARWYAIAGSPLSEASGERCSEGLNGALGFSWRTVWSSVGSGEI